MLVLAFALATVCVVVPDAAASAVDTSPSIALGPPSDPGFTSEWLEPVEDPSLLERNFIRKRRYLATSVGVSAGLLVAGGLTVGLLGSAMRCDEGFCTELGILAFTGTAALSVVAIHHVIAAGLLGHHERWHDPRDSYERRTRGAYRRTLGLGSGLAVSASALVAGISTMFLPMSEHCDSDCSILALRIGGALVIAGSISTAATGTLFGLHATHQHEVRPRVSVRAGLGGLSLVF